MSNGTNDLMGNENPISRAITKPIAGAIQVSMTGGLAVQDMSQAMEVAKLMAIAGMAVPGHLRNNPGGCLAVAIQGWEWGINPFAIANKSYVVNDRLAYESSLFHAVVLRRAPIIGRLKIEYAGQAGTRTCKVSAKVRPEGDEPVESVDYESPQIQNIRPQNSPLWKNDPDQQLFYFAVRAFTRRHFPDVMMGVYTADELQDQPPQDTSVMRIQQIADAPVSPSQQAPKPVIDVTPEPQPPKPAAQTPVDRPTTSAAGAAGGTTEQPKRGRGRPAKAAEPAIAPATPTAPATAPVPQTQAATVVTPVATAPDPVPADESLMGDSPADPPDSITPTVDEEMQIQQWMDQATNASTTKVLEALAKNEAMADRNSQLKVIALRQILTGRGLDDQGRIVTPPVVDQVTQALNMPVADPPVTPVPAAQPQAADPVPAEASGDSPLTWPQFLDQAKAFVAAQYAPTNPDPAKLNSLVAAAMKATAAKFPLRQRWIGAVPDKALTPAGQDAMFAALDLMADGKWNWTDAKAV